MLTELPASLLQNLHLLIKISGVLDLSHHSALPCNVFLLQSCITTEETIMNLFPW